MQLSRQWRDTLCGRTWPWAGRHGGRLLGLVRVVPLLHAGTHRRRTCTMGSTLVRLCLRCFKSSGQPAQLDTNEPAASQCGRQRPQT